MRLGREFFATTPEKLARELLGMRLVRVLEDGARLSGIIVETEAYCGVKDKGSHAYGGRRTPRNEAMYAAPGTAYVYFTYGMHYCMNIVCGEVDVPLAVLLRAIEPLEGIDRMHEQRGSTGSGRVRPQTDLCSGPGKLCKALAIDRGFNLTDMVTSRSLFLESPGDGIPRRPRGRVQRTARIGIGYAGDWVHRPLRWLVAGSPHTSPARPSTPPAPKARVRHVR